MLSGAWRNFDHIEEELTLQELVEIVKAQRAREERDYRMTAALKGIDLDKGKKQEDDPVEAAKRRVALRRAEEAGLNEQQYEAKESEKRLQQMGFVVVKE